MKTRIYECENKCVVTDKGYNSCPRCGGRMRDMGYAEKEDVIEEVRRRQQYHAGKIPERIVNSYTRALKDKFKKEEEEYKYNKKKWQR